MKLQNHLLYLFPVLAFQSCGEGKKVEKPNIILILADDLGYNDVSCYRRLNDQQSEKPPTSETPNIDKLANEGILFTDFYCGAAVCSPSRAALITGRNATRVGIYNWIPENCPMHLRSEEITIAELLKNKGYITGHFGKWHLTSANMNQPLPNDQGFDYSFFTYNNAEPSHLNPVNFYRNGEPVGNLEGFACHLVMDETLKWMKGNQNTSSPFYLNIWFNEPHMKVAAPPELTSKHEYNKDYYGAIENMDLAIGRLIDYLKENNLENNTLIIFTSDNGSQWPHSNDPFRGKKAFNYEGGIHVPFIIKYPLQISNGKTINVTGSFTDVLPTLANLSGFPMPSDRTYDGISLWPLLKEKNRTMKRNDPVFFFRYFHDPICMLREDEWCLLGYDELIPYIEDLNTRDWAKIKPAEGEPTWSQWGFQQNHMRYLKNLEPKYFELYNLKEDPEQKVNIAEKNPDRVIEMKNLMIILRKEMIEEGGDWYGE